MLLHATGTLDEIISHVTIFPATGKHIKDKKLKSKPVPNSLSVFEEKQAENGSRSGCHGLSWMTFMDDCHGQLSWMTFMDDFHG